MNNRTIDELGTWRTFQDFKDEGDDEIISKEKAEACQLIMPNSKSITTILHLYDEIKVLEQQLRNWRII